MTNVFEEATKHTDGKTLILSNGYHWGGAVSDGINKLVQVLRNYPLCPRFEQYHCYRPQAYTPLGLKFARVGEAVAPWIGATSFWGNFHGLSHGFHVITRDSAVLAQLNQAIQENVASEQYQREAFELYCGWFYAKRPGSSVLISPEVKAYLDRGEMPPWAHRQALEAALKETVILTPRFTDEEIARYSSSKAA